MKKLSNCKAFFLGVALTLFLVSFVTPVFAASLTKTAELVYNNIKITLNGKEIAPKDVSGNVVEPFIIDGTTYLPVRAISNALGIDVDWDGSTNTVVLEDNTTPQDDSFISVEMLGFYKIIQEELEYLYSGFNVLGKDIQWAMDTVMTSDPYVGQSYCAAQKAQTEYNLSLVEEHFAECHYDLSSDGTVLMAEYRRLAKMIISYYNDLDNNPSSSFIQRVVGAANQNAVDCYMAKAKASSLFWKTYQDAWRIA